MQSRVIGSVWVAGSGSREKGGQISISVYLYWSWRGSAVTCGWQCLGSWYAVASVSRID